MRPTGWWMGVALACLLSSCDGTGTDPLPPDSASTFKVERFSISEVWIDTPYTAFYPCANEGEGELLDGWGTWAALLSGHYTPSGTRPGKSEARWSGLPPEDPEYMGPDYLLIGQISGDGWVVDGKTSRFMEHRTILPDGSSGYHQTLNIFAKRADGEKLHIQGSYQYKWDGGFTMYNVNRGSCPEIW